MIKFENPVIKQLLDEYKPLYGLDHALSIMGWDLWTYMPRGGTESRGQATSQILLVYRRFFLEDKFKSLVLKAKEIEGLNDFEKGVVRSLNRELKIMDLPSELLEREAMAKTKALTAWESARKKSDFKMFSPHLDSIIEIEREKAEKLGYEEHPYNALIDRYEEGMNVKKLDGVFSTLVPKLKKILDGLEKNSPFEHESELDSAGYDKERMKIVNEELLKTMGFDFNKFRMDVSAHPFTIMVGPGDVRITTKYEGGGFKRSIFPTIHEAGHATYNLAIDPTLGGTPIFSGASLGIHESQSRFFENMIGRSKEFTQLIMPILKGNLGLQGYDENDIYYYFNNVKRGFIRMEADELTYNFHIALRYDLEKSIMEGKVNTNELPELWNSKMEEYLGISPKSDSEGILQDVHWTSGFGYFPTYALGNIVSGIVLYWARKEIKDFGMLIGSGKLQPIKEWLMAKIHRFGGTYSPSELLKRSFNEDYNPEYLISYLEEKYLGDVGHGNRV